MTAGSAASAERRKALQAFLAGTSWADAAREPLPGDASFRHYIRLRRDDGTTSLVMDAPPPREDVRPFVAVARHLLACGFSAPEILVVDEKAGFLLLEDFGEETFTRLLARAPGREAELYELAVDCLAALHRHPRAARLTLPPYDEAALLREAALLVDWYYPAMTGQLCSSECRASYLEAWRRVFRSLPIPQDGLVLRDFHVDNLMLLPGREGIGACGLLDFQDALSGPLAYDLASLLEDARRDIDPKTAAILRRRYAKQAPAALDPDSFDLWFAVLAAQRHAKVAGIFVRLLWRDGKDVYLKHIPRVTRLLEKKLETTPSLAPVADWMQRHLPEYRNPLPPGDSWRRRSLPTPG